MIGLDFPGATPPGFWPDTSNHVFPRYAIPGFTPPGFAFPGESPAFITQPLVVLTTEMAGWIEGKLGVGVYPNHLPFLATDFPYLSYQVVDKEAPLLLNGTAGITFLSV